MSSDSAANNPQVGPLADEAAKLVAAALAWAQRAATAVDPTGEHLATGAPECTGCPVCRTVAALRDPSAELADRLTGMVIDFAQLVASGLRTANESAFGDARPHNQAAGSEQEPPRTGGARRPRPGVEHIDIS